jgi:phosphoenolpyruvate-protein kinase (PTS system EI component)
MKEVSLEGKIVLIEGADPGFDWIFSQNIIGLITKYGGANSHMAIRSAEFDMPAAIGCGEQRFDRLLQANNIHLDCSAGLINPLN